MANGVNGNGESLRKWAMTAVLTAVLALAAIGYLDQRKTGEDNAADIKDVRAGDAKFDTRITLVEDRYLTIREQNRQILDELRQLNARGRRAYVQSGHSSRPSNGDVLNGNP